MSAGFQVGGRMHLIGSYDCFYDCAAGLGYVPAETDQYKHWQRVDARSNVFEEVTPKLGPNMVWSIEDPTYLKATSRRQRGKPVDIIDSPSGWEYAFDFWRFDLRRRAIHLRPHTHCFVRRRKWMAGKQLHAFCFHTMTLHEHVAQYRLVRSHSSQNAWEALELF